MRSVTAAILIVLTIALFSPLTIQIPASGQEGSFGSIMTLDVCSSNSGALSSGADIPAIQESLGDLTDLVFCGYVESPESVHRPFAVSYIQEHPPKS